MVLQDVKCPSWAFWPLSTGSSETAVAAVIGERLATPTEWPSSLYPGILHSVE